MKTQTETKLGDLYKSDPVSACRKALRLTANIPENDRLEAINSLLEMYGTEAIRGDWQNGYWCDIVAAYCNAGDTYCITVIQVRGESSFNSSRFIVSSWGDWVEKNQTKYGIQ
jgi:hypothetical protein